MSKKNLNCYGGLYDDVCFDLFVELLVLVYFNQTFILFTYGEND